MSDPRTTNMAVGYVGVEVQVVAYVLNIAVLVCSYPEKEAGPKMVDRRVTSESTREARDLNVKS